MRTILGRTKKILKILVFIFVAIPLLVFLSLGRLLFKNANFKAANLIINKAQADVPVSCGGGCGGGGGDSGEPHNDCSSDCASTSEGGNSSAGGSGDGGDGGDGGGSGGCFKAGTLIATAINDKNEFTFKKIEELKVGDEITGVKFDENGNPVIVKSKVLKSLIHESALRKFLSMTTKRGAEIIATDNHRFIIDGDNNAVPLGQMSLNAKVVSAFSDPEWDKVEKIQTIGNSEELVYNIQTQTSNYLVSQDGKACILVHNEK